MNPDRHLTKREIDAIADEMLAADRYSEGALPLTPDDEKALERIRQAVLAEAAKPRRLPWWKRWSL